MLTQRRTHEQRAADKRHGKSTIKLPLVLELGKKAFGCSNVNVQIKKTENAKESLESSRPANVGAGKESQDLKVVDANAEMERKKKNRGEKQRAR